MNGVPDLPRIVERQMRLQDAASGWRKDLLHASDLGAILEDEGCVRQIWLRVRGAAGRAATPGELLMWAKANEIHKYMAELFKERLPIDYPGWRVTAIELADAEHEGEARLDIMIEDPQGGRWIVDLKSKRSNAFHYGNIFTERAKLQVQDYARRWKTNGAIVLATDREGSNFCRQQVYGRDDYAVTRAWAKLRTLVASPKPPPLLAPKATFKETKTKGTSVTLEEVWQCSWCQFRDISCPGCLPPEARGRVAGHVSASGAFAPAPGREALAPIAQAALAVALAKRDGGLPAAEPGEAGAGPAAEGGGQGGAETDEPKGEE